MPRRKRSPECKSRYSSECCNIRIPGVREHSHSSAICTGPTATDMTSTTKAIRSTATVPMKMASSVVGPASSNLSATRPGRPTLKEHDVTKSAQPINPDNTSLVFRRMKERALLAYVPLLEGQIASATTKNKLTKAAKLKKVLRVVQKPDPNMPLAKLIDCEILLKNLKRRKEEQKKNKKVDYTWSENSAPKFPVVDLVSPVASPAMKNSKAVVNMISTPASPPPSVEQSVVRPPVTNSMQDLICASNEFVDAVHAAMQTPDGAQTLRRIFQPAVDALLGGRPTYDLFENEEDDDEDYLSFLNDYPLI